MTLLTMTREVKNGDRESEGKAAMDKRKWKRYPLAAGGEVGLCFAMYVCEILEGGT